MFSKKNGLNTLSIADIIEGVFSAWSRVYTTVFFVIFFGMCAWSVFLWYYSLYYFHWDAQQKQTYIDTQAPRSVLDMKDFETVFEGIDNRNTIHETEPLPVKSIFMTDPKVK